MAVFWTKKGLLWQRRHKAGSSVLRSPVHRLPTARLLLCLIVRGAERETEAGRQAGSGSQEGLVAEPGPAPVLSESVALLHTEAFAHTSLVTLCSSALWGLARVRSA